ncbi:hypothetical protein JYT15_00080 [Acidimicrobium ferrooxidans]|nr:hypothetical protein [Acidimicrobium ferrooxidans]
MDLQILAREEVIDYGTIAVTARRLFAARLGLAWPPTIVAYDRWDTIYVEAADGLDVIDNVTEAVEWANEFIARIERGGDSGTA